MSFHRKTLLATASALALASTLPAHAQSSADLLNELKALKDRVGELEKKLKAAEAAKPQWGMTPEQAQQLNRVEVKTEAMEDSRDAAGFKGLKISGYADPTYIYNKEQNRAGFQFLNRVEDGGYTYDNSYMGAAVIDFQKETEGGTLWRLTLAPNRGIGTVFSGDSPVHEASVSVPMSDGVTRFIAGQIPDWSGYEYLPATQNKLITHNLLFDFTLPTVYVGAGFDFPVGDIAMKAMIANVNSTMKGSGSKKPALVYRGDYELNEFSGFGFAGLHGKVPNFANDKDTTAHLFEVDGWYTRGDLTLNGQVTVGTQKEGSITPAADGSLRRSQWWGFSALAAYKFMPRLEGTVRFDYLNNRKNGGGLFTYVEFDPVNGIGPDPTGGDPDKGANRMALTVGASYLFDENVTFKAEYRLDRASHAVFGRAKDGFNADESYRNYTKSNHLLGASVVVSF